MAAFDPVFGDPALLPQIHKVQTKGNVFRGIIKYIQANFDEETVNKLVATLPPEARRVFQTLPLASSWLPFSLQMDIVKALVQGPFRGDVGRVRGVSAQVARDDLSTVYKVLLKMLSAPSFFLNRIGTVFDMYFKGASMSGETVEPGHAVITLTGPMPYYYCTQAMPGWVDAALEIYRAKNREVKHTQCVHKGGKSCKWDVFWE